MTIISTAKPVSLDEALAIADAREQEIVNEANYDLFPSFPPIDDAVSAVKSIDWADVRMRSRKGLNNVGLVVAVLGEKLHDFGVFLAEV
jgi:hypothetical protein